MVGVAVLRDEGVVARVDGRAEGGAVGCCFWGVGVGMFDEVGLRMFEFWFPGC